MYRDATGQLLPPPDRYIDVFGLQLDAGAATSSPFRRYQRRARSQEGVEDQLAPLRAVFDCLDQQRHRLDRWMVGKSFIASTTKGGEARVAPYIGAVATMAAELDIVEVRRASLS